MITPNRFFSSQHFRLRRRVILVSVFVSFVCFEFLLGSGFLFKNPYLSALVIVPVIPLVIFGFLLRLEYGAVIGLFTMFFMQTFLLPTGTETLLPFSLIFVLLWTVLWLVKMALNNEIKVAVSKFNLPAFVYVAITIIALFWSRFAVDPQLVIPAKFSVVQLGTIGVTLASIMTTLLAANVVRRESIVKICFFLMMFGSVIYLPIYFFDDIHLGGTIGRMTGPAGLASDWFGARGLLPMWDCALCMGYLLFYKNKDARKWHRYAVGLLFVCWLFRVFVISLVRISSWLPVLTTLMVILFFYSRKWFFTVCVVGLILFAFTYNLFYDTIILEKAEEGTLAGQYSRQNLFVQALTLGKDHLLLGTGPAGYRNYYIIYYPDVVLSTHNNYLDMFLQYGIIGLLIFLWVLFSLVKEVWKAMKWQKPGSFGQAFTISTLGGSMGMLVGMTLGDWVVPFAYNQTLYGFCYTAYNWLFPGLAMALGYIARQQAQAEQTKLLQDSEVSTNKSGV